MGQKKEEYENISISPSKIISHHYAEIRGRKGIERHLNDTFGMVSSVLCVWDFLRLNMIDATAEVVTFVMHTFHLLILFSPFCYFTGFLKLTKLTFRFGLKILIFKLNLECDWILDFSDESKRLTLKCRRFVQSMFPSKVLPVYGDMV